MENPLDQYCEKIFSLLMVARKKYRFNELHRTLGTFGASMSTPTLIEHLTHLQKRGFIKRKKEDKQNVSYQVNWKKFQTLKESLEFKQQADRDLQSEKTFKSMPLDDQIVTITSIFALRDLLYLKLFVLDILEPHKKPEHRFSYIFMGQGLDRYKWWLLDSCKESKETSEKALKLIQRGIEGLRNELFGAKPKP